MLSPRNSSSTTYRLQVTQPVSTLQTVSKQSQINPNPNPTSIYYQNQIIRQQKQGSNISGNPSISFGQTGSAFKYNTGVNIKNINYQNGDYYQGDINIQGQPHGYGKYYYINNKHQYHGQFENGRPQGKGQLYKNIGNTNITNMNQNPSTIQQLKSNLGSNLFLVYDGEWKNGMKNGEGRYFYNSQNHYYQGPWLNDQRHGNQGLYVSPIGKYVGKWKNGKMDGRGQFFINRTGTNYVGNFQNNEFINGVITYQNKDQYSGAVRNGLRDDNQGRYHYNRFGINNQQVRYIGGWKNDRKYDQSGLVLLAIITYPNGQILKGVYKDGKFIDSAQCTYQWNDGSMFKGWLKKNNNGYGLKGFVKETNGKQYQV